MDIPVFHDDQHGTAIISGAALLNAVEIAGKKLGEMKVVFSGAGAAGIACDRFYVALGAKPENILMRQQGRDLQGRGERHEQVQEGYARKTTAAPWKTPFVGADVFSDFPRPTCVDPEMVRSMNRTRSSSPWPTPTRRSPTTRWWPPGPM
jgi:malate dehydrogenase (oxaloacetate-decarboxylating)(NADP+)